MRSFIIWIYVRFGKFLAVEYPVKGTAFFYFNKRSKVTTSIPTETTLAFLTAIDQASTANGSARNANHRADTIKLVLYGLIIR